MAELQVVRKKGRLSFVILACKRVHMACQECAECSKKGMSVCSITRQVHGATVKRDNDAATQGSRAAVSYYWRSHNSLRGSQHLVEQSPHSMPITGISRISTPSGLRQAQLIQKRFEIKNGILDVQ